MDDLRRWLDGYLEYFEKRESLTCNNTELVCNIAHVLYKVSYVRIQIIVRRYVFVIAEIVIKVMIRTDTDTYRKIHKFPYKLGYL